MRFWTLLTFLALPSLALASDPAAMISGITATPRGGQIFLTWQEADTPPGATFSVYRHDRPIVDLGVATRIAWRIEPHSARDWWADPASFDVKKPSAAPVGYRLDAGARLDPSHGLFVYTVEPGDPTHLYFAVTLTGADGHESRDLTSGNATAAIEAQPGPILAFWQHDTDEPPPGAGKDRALWMRLHGRGSVVPNMEYLAFGDRHLGWRPGLAFKFSVTLDDQTVFIQPTDRTWVGPARAPSTNARAPAIWTFWYGYNSRIDDPDAMATGVPTNYTERRLLWILDFVGRRYQPDRNRFYLSGSSMGGCGTLSFGFRHPDLFAALHAHVPIVSYTYEKPTSAHRLEQACWTGPIPANLLTDEGVPLLDRMDAVRTVRESPGQLPFLFMVNGRKDTSIPWHNNPPFYRAMNASRRALVAYWDEGTHPTAGVGAPDDIKAWEKRLRRFKLTESYPAFSNTSSNSNPGEGPATDGDPVGWINRGFDWRDIVDQPDRYEITLSLEHPGIVYPVTTDVTLWRLQRFSVAAGDRVRWSVGSMSGDSVTVDRNGGVTITGVTFASPQPLRLTLERASSRGN
jgi:hypothetical protein